MKMEKMKLMASTRTASTNPKNPFETKWPYIEDLHSSCLFGAAARGQFYVRFSAFPRAVCCSSVFSVATVGLFRIRFPALQHVALRSMVCFSSVFCVATREAEAIGVNTVDCTQLV